MPKSLFIDPAKLMESGHVKFNDIPVNQYGKTVAQERAAFGDGELVRIYRDMAILREFESMLNRIKTQGNYNGVETTYPGPAHLSLGQESAAVGQAYLLGREDCIFGSHRSHSEVLAKSLSCIQKLPDGELMSIMEGFFGGAILRSIEKVYKAADAKDLAIHFLLYGALAELFARENGFHKGMGGSMHMFFLPFGVYPNNAIVGGSGTIAAGAALYKKCNGKGGLVICNIGDGSLGCGPVWEALNFAAMGQYDTLWEDGKKGGLPIIFNIFNNGYGMGGQTSGETMAYDMPVRVSAGVSPGGMGAERVWGHNPLAVIDAYRRKRKLIESAKGPVFLDVLTYRLVGHSTSDQNAYRSKEEIDAWQEVDPCTVFRRQLVEAGVAGDGAFDDIWAETGERMTKICKWASDMAMSPYADFNADGAVIERMMFSGGRGSGSAAPAAASAVAPVAATAGSAAAVAASGSAGSPAPAPVAAPVAAPASSAAPAATAVAPATAGSAAPAPAGSAAPAPVAAPAPADGAAARTAPAATLIAKEACSRVKQIAGKERSAFKDGKPVSKMRQYNIRDAIFEPLLDKFYEDPTLIAYGEDVRDWGGAFAVYRGLAEALPHSRLFNAPISEAAIVGTGVGYGMCGGRAVVELMYCDFIGRAGDEVFNQLSKWQAMSAGILKMPVVLRVSIGAKYGAQHSQDWTALCAHIPGLKVCFPATPYEAKGLMAAALNGEDPVVFFESQRIYDMGEMFREGGVPSEPYELAFGDVNVVRAGSDVTVLTIGATLYKAVEAADQLEDKYGLSAEVINLHSLVPLDYSRIAESVAKTGRVVLASDACARGSFLNDVARNITELCFDDLDAPPVVVGARNWITPPFEFDEYFFPQAGWILDAIHEKLLPLPGYSPATNGFLPVEQLRRARAGV
ncbi:MAG: dehydrogenase [Clostridiales bacterium]|jgi:pyruvate/2-oxoglutarate/acetoin dehydrogenase E1 component/TPP-dependent pyruvate/acetoin dehydrogenase alpha subunit|nr:dehydrogenase [Clostridiales bacterium]